MIVFSLSNTMTPIFYCIKSIRTVSPTQYKKVDKNLFQILHGLNKDILRKKLFRLEDCTSSYRRHGLLFECSANLKLFGHVLYDADDCTVNSRLPDTSLLRRIRNY